MNTGSTQKIKLPLDSESAPVSWSPDSLHLAVFRKKCSDTSCNSGIYVVNADGTGLVNLTKDSADDSISHRLAWSPDGTLIAFARGIGLEFVNRVDEVYVMRSDGSNQTQLTDSKQIKAPSGIYWIVWSHDGTKIAFVRQTGNNSNNADNEIYLLKADGSAPVKLASERSSIRGIAWSGDDSYLAINESTMIGGGMFRVSLDGSGVTPWLSGGSQPAWSLDGSRIAFTSARTESKNDIYIDLYVMNADGTGKAKVMSNARCNFAPTWIP